MRCVKRIAIVILVAGCGTSSPPANNAPTPLEIKPMPSASATWGSPPSTASVATDPEVARPHNPQRAEELFREAKQAIENGDLVLARDRLEASHRLDPAVGTLLNLAEVEARLGDVTNARRHYQEVVDKATAAGRTDRAAFAKQRLDALPR
jgi:hypothetical protein